MKINLTDPADKVFINVSLFAGVVGIRSEGKPGTDEKFPKRLAREKEMRKIRAAATNVTCRETRAPSQPACRIRKSLSA